VDQSVKIAANHNFTLPQIPDPIALEAFLARAKTADLLRFPDQYLAVIKPLKPGEYIAAPPERIAPGPFGLAVKDYAHSTAPNRRYPDLMTQRLLKTALVGKPVLSARLRGISMVL